MNTRCYDHKDNSIRPRGCATCNRIALEATIVTKTVRALLAAGFELRVDDGQDLRPAQHTTSAAEIKRELMQVDDEYLQARKTGKHSWVRFVYGNDGYDVISDYTTDLEEVLSDVNNYADRMGG